MAREFAEILEESESSTYGFRVKTVVEPNEARMEALERLLRRYDLREIVGPLRTILQAMPMDFREVGTAEVYIIDVVLGIPASAYILQQELVATWLIPEKYVVVRSVSDNLELQDRDYDLKQELRHEMIDKEMMPGPHLSTDPAYPEAELYTDVPYGNDYNNDFLTFVASVRAHRPNRVVKAESSHWDLEKNPAEEGVVGHSSDTFNVEIDGAPKVHRTKDAKTKVTDPRKFRTGFNSSLGNFDSDKKPVSAVVTDWMGKKELIKRV